MLLKGPVFLVLEPLGEMRSEDEGEGRTPRLA